MDSEVHILPVQVYGTGVRYVLFVPMSGAGCWFSWPAGLPPLLSVAAGPPACQQFTRAGTGCSCSAGGRRRQNLFLLRGGQNSTDNDRYCQVETKQMLQNWILFVVWFCQLFYCALYLIFMNVP